MALKLYQKKIIVNNIKKVIKKSLSILYVNFLKLSSNSLNLLRKNSRNLKVFIYIIKNSLIKKALKKTKFDYMIKYLNNQTIVAFSCKHPGSAARLFDSFEEKDNVQMIYAGFNNKILKNNEINDLVVFPTYEEVILKFVLLFKENILKKFIFLLSKLCVR